ncbi:hypothetical protein U9M48_014023 [Paspalum notatum var. saurae]|uniref:Uncharacterized protein n=1 Tax=Paspalum notatum var. saurae TaxID=547442 RepID=A0AAQ3WKB6_PASNO
MNTTAFLDMGGGRAPAVLDWSIRNQTCEAAKRNQTTGVMRAAAPIASVSIPPPVDLQGTCATAPKAMGAIHIFQMDAKTSMNAMRGGRVLQKGFATTQLVDTNVLVDFMMLWLTAGRCVNKNIGVTMAFILLMVLSFCWYMIHQKRKQKKAKQEYFRQHGGMILFETMKSENGLAFTVFTEAELRDATNNYDKSRIIGKGGHGTVYKGVG